MKKFILVSIALLFGSFAFAANPKIRLPDPTKAQAAPLIVNAVPKLTPDLLYVVESEVELVTLTSPDTVVKITAEKAPLNGVFRYKGKFFDSDGKVTTRDYKGPFIYVVEGVKAGQSEIFFVPVGLKTKDEIASQKLEVAMEGGNDVKPPVPDPKPNPNPARSVYIAIIRDPGNVDAATARILSDIKFWDGFKVNDSDWGSYSNTDEAAIANKYVEAVRPVQSGDKFVTSLLILDKKTGVPLKAVKLPTSKDEITKVINEAK